MPLKQPLSCQSETEIDRRKAYIRARFLRLKWEHAWSNDYPTEPGLYLFYGKLKLHAEYVQENRYYMVEVSDAPEGLNCFMHGQPLNNFEPLEGAWQRINVVFPPEEWDLEYVDANLHRSVF